MERLEIKIVGNGGCLNNGLPYNACLINGHFLVEAPPDVMVSLLKLNIDFEQINTVFISHLHGDHTFGLPFLIINKWVASLQSSVKSRLTLIGPHGTEQHVRNITEAAFTRSHPCYTWLEKNILFEIINTKFERTLNDLSLSCFNVQHLVETYGLLLSKKNKMIFAYIADTSWCRQVERILAGKPKIILMDMNGGDSNVHISLDEVIEKGIPVTGSDSIYYGTHLAEEFDSADASIKCAKPGEVITVRYE
ncbi:MBL fold metallo-hydrolase [Thermodesulfobacteriota bacterium]